MITSINKFKKIFESIENDISIIEDNLPSERWSGSWFTDFFTTKKNDKIYVGIVVGGKRGYPRDAYIKALKTPKPKLPNGFTYTTGTPIDIYNNKPVTLKSIKEDDKMYDDRGYTDSEFDGAIYYEVTKTTNESKITENVDTDNTDTFVEALTDIDERRPNRMKRPPKADYNPWNGRGGERGMVYIQDEAEEVMQDKYGRERGTRNWEASIGHGARGGAMFKMADDVMKEKQFLFDELGLTPKSYWDYSYFDMWKKWMNKIGKIYKIDSDADVQAKKDAKEQAEKEAKRLAKEKKQQEAKNKLTEYINKIRDKYSSLNLDKFTPDAKDRKRIEDLINNNRSTSSTLANKMANAIKNRTKAIKRGLAAIEYYENLTDVDTLTYLYAEDVIKPFFDKAMKLNESKITEDVDINQLEKTIKDLKEKIKNQGHVTNARDEEHLENLLELYEDAIEQKDDNFDKKYYDNDEDAYFKRQQYESKLFTSINEFKQYIKESNNDMLHINLLDKYRESGNDILYREKFDKFKHKIEGFKETHDELDLKIGDIIEFNGGYNNDIRYTTEILGFDSDNDIYLLWESYWYPIQNDNKRNIIKVNNNKINEQILNNSEKIINLEFEDQTDISNNKYSFSFETVDSEGAPILDYSGTIKMSSKYERNPDDIDWDLNVPEDWDDAEKYILDEFYKWLRRNKTNESNNSDYQVYHKQYSSAIDEVKKYANKLGYSIDEDGLAFAYVDGFFKPKEGETKKDSIELFKDDKKMKKQLHVQIYNRGKAGYELNMYVN